ncbi:MAG TPA: hypothetical protein VNQ79_12150 [Blastocatellia bacterium]|nr:hypothetical protein [Blastocatellia bacterium]
MRTSLHLIRIAALALTLTAIQVTTPAQDPAETRAWVESTLRYFSCDSKFTPAETGRLAELRVKLHAPASTLEERQGALREMVQMIFRAAGTTPPPEPFLNRFSQNQGKVIHALITDPTAKPVSRSNTPLGELGHVEKRGRGPVPMILISDVRTDWTIWQSFMERNAERYTMYAVTLPGAAARLRRRARQCSI